MRRLISSFLIFCLTFSQVAQAYTQAWLPHQPAQHTTQDPQHLNTHLTTLAQQPGQAWIGQLANDPNVKVQWKQTQTAVQQWDYSHEGLTPEAAGVIALVVAYASAGTAGSAAGSLTGAAGGTTIASAAVTAGLTTLASQASVTLINNKGNVGNTLNDLGRSDNVKALVTAMVTAGALTQLGQSINIGKTNLNGINAKSPFIDQLQKNLINNTASTIVNHAINGGDLQQQLEQSLKTAFIDTGAAQGANWIGDMKAKDNLNAFTHKLAHAIAGCAAGAAKSNDCSSGALGAVVGEMSAELYIPDDSRGLTPKQLREMQRDMVGFSKMMSGVAAALTGQDVNLAAGAGANAAENNYLSHWQKEAYGKELTNCKDEFCRWGTHLRWMGTSVNQDAALVTGMALGAGIEVKDAAAALTELPQTIAMLAQQPDLLKTLGDGYLNDLKTTYNDYQVALEAAGVDGATAAGAKFTHLLSQLALLPATVATAGAVASYTTTKMGGLLSKIGKTEKTVVAGAGANTLTNISGDLNQARNAARNQPYGNGNSASPSLGTNTAGSSGRNVDAGRTFEEYAGLGDGPNWGTGPLRPSAQAVLENQGVLIDSSYGLQSRSAGFFADVQMGMRGDLETKYLYTVDQRGLNIVLERTPVMNNPAVKHTNLSAEASIGGEAWFGPNNTVTINAGSGRFGDGAGVTKQQWNATVKFWESLGYKVNPIPLGKR